MHKPQDTDPNVNLGDSGAVSRDSDTMETLEPGTNVMADSPSSEADAGLIDPTRQDDEDVAVFREMDETTPEMETPMEVPMSDLEYQTPELHSPVMSDMNAPGEIDMEELNEETVREALPPDARLDPIEE